MKHSTKKECKVKQLTKNKEDELFCFVLEFLLNTDKKTGVSVAKINKNLSDNVQGENFDSIKELIEYVLENNTGQDKVIKTIQNFINDQSEVYHQFLKDIITKKYKCGVTAKVASEIIPDVIKKEHQVMLANKFKGDLKEPMQMTLKLDGIRCSTLIEDGNIQFLSRQGKKLKGLLDIENAIQAMNLDNYMLDGELIRKNIDNLPSEENFKLTTSIVSSDTEDKKGLEYVIFDIVPLQDYKNRVCELDYQTRKNMLYKLIETNEFIRLVPMLGTAQTEEDIYNNLDDVVSQGLEGLMLNSFTGLYKFGKRSNDLLKVKKFDSCDIYCTGVEEGTGKYEGTLGAIICDYKGYKLKVGSGLTDEQRDYYWKHQSEIVNRIVEIKYFEESSDKEGNLSLRFPVFKCVREKDEVSYE